MDEVEYALFDAEILGIRGSQDSIEISLSDVDIEMTEEEGPISKQKKETNEMEASLGNVIEKRSKKNSDKRRMVSDNIDASSHVTGTEKHAEKGKLFHVKDDGDEKTAKKMTGRVDKRLFQEMEDEATEKEVESQSVEGKKRIVPGNNSIRTEKRVKQYRERVIAGQKRALEVENGLKQPGKKYSRYPKKAIFTASENTDEVEESTSPRMQGETNTCGLSDREQKKQTRQSFKNASGERCTNGEGQKIVGIGRIESDNEESEEHLYDMDSEHVGTQEDMGPEPRSLPAGFTYSDMTLSKLAESQEQVLTPRRERALKFQATYTPRVRASGLIKNEKKDGETGAVTRMLTVAEQWEQDMKMLKKYKPDFFSNDEAIMKDTGIIGKGRSSYASLSLTHLNNHDVKRVYEIEYQTKIQDGHSRASYQIFCSVIGQYMRLAVVLGLVPVQDVCRKGAVFKCIVDRDCLRVFFNYFEIRGAVTTSMTKAIHLTKMADYAIGYFEETGNSQMMSLSRLSHLFLQGMRNSKKQMGRREATRRKDLSDRVEEGKFLLPTDFSKCTKFCTSKLSKIRAVVLKKCSELARKKVKGKNTERHASHELSEDEQEKNEAIITEVGKKIFKSNFKLLNKWCLNFISVLMLTAGGQRPQVFTQLQAPSKREMEQMVSKSKEKGFVELRTLVEKTMRSMDMPNVILPVAMCEFIRFHMEMVRPVIVETSGFEEDFSSRSNRPLLLNTKNGESLTSQQVTKTFRTFMTGVDEDFGNITTMSLRGSYATMMMRLYKDKKSHQDLSEREFLEHLGKAMNTSPEQLMTTYISLDTSDYEVAARKMVDALRDATGNEDLEKVLSEDVEGQEESC